ncbi:MAG: c-type cytochrome [Pseudomonadota bacterium]
MKKLFLIALAAVAIVIAIAWPREQMLPSTYAATPANIARGAYLAKAGDCVACHTARGGAPFAGGRALATPFGKLVAPNITPDRETGLGAWTPDDFWNALHNGKSRDGHLLYPAFPYTNYTKVTRPDADALFAYLQSLPPVRRASEAHTLRWPYNQQFMLAAWRLLYFRPAVFEPAKDKGADWNRGAYLVEGLGHCSACHSSRNSFGASEAGLSGGLIPMLGWYAPSLTSDAEAGLGSWDIKDITALLHTGASPRATVFGPMAEVVQASLQHLDDTDIHAMSTYLKALPATPAEPPEPLTGPSVAQVLANGKKLYGDHCADCHGIDGKGMAPAYPPLAGNRALTMEDAANPIRIVLNGGFAPGTKGNPRPYGMPPYSHVMDDFEVAAVVSYLRASWGNHANVVASDEVNRYRSVPVD